jgi:LPS-assembly protein
MRARHVALLLPLLAPLPGLAQPAGSPLGLLGQERTFDRNTPVTFTAQEVEYDEGRGVVTARGAVEAWQNQRVLRADRFTYDRNTGLATAEGNVQLIEPDGQVVFAERVELTGGFRDGAVEGLSALLAQNGRMVAAGARRTGGLFTDLARVLYSACDLCPDNPEAPPLWQLRARVATQDQEQQRIRFRDASLEMAGLPVLYTPYLSMPDPSTPRASGFLTPSFGYSRFLGGFTELPYYWAIDESSDLTLTPLIGTRQAPNLGLAYRRRFNRGELEASGSIGYLDGTDTQGERGFAGHIFSRGLFALDETWRAGFDLNRATSETYLRAYRFGSPRMLTSQAFTEGFWGTEGYARFDTRIYQSLRSDADTAQIPFVLPNAFGEYVFPRDRLGGFLGVDAGAFAVSRDIGTDTRRFATRAGYALPATDAFGSLWTFRTQLDALGYSADGLNEPPNNADRNSISRGTGNVRVALDWRLPLVRSAGDWGSQLVEPRVQLVSGPSTGRQTLTPNEDSLDLEFTDANLFALNRYPGRDRLEGGTRVDAALRGAWLFPNGGQVEGLAGRSLRTSRGVEFPEGSGLEERASDWVGRLRLSPLPWLDLLGRTRLDGDSFDRRLIDVAATVGLGPVTVGGGYLYTTPTPQLNRQRREVSGAVSTRLSTHWRATAFGRYDVEIDRAVAAGVSATYEDECLIFDARFVKNWAEDPATSTLYPSNTLLLLRIGFKTIGDFGFRAI